MKWQKAAVILGLIMGTLVAVVGVAHTSMGRPLLGLLGVVPGCPVSLDHVDPARVEAYRKQQMARHSGRNVARALPASGFELGMTRSATRSRLDRLGGECEDRRSGSAIACARVKDSEGGEMRELHLQFDGRDRLVAVDLFRESACGRDALRRLSRVQNTLESQVGPVTHRQGEATSTFLEAGRFRRTATEFRYSNYHAELSAMGDGSGGVLVRESYQWLPAS